MNMHTIKNVRTTTVVVPLVALLVTFVLTLMLSFGYATNANAAVFAPACTNLSAGLSIGSNDGWAAGEVTKLQNFLFAEGDMQVSATGYFGSVTLGAVKSFQASQGIWTTGYVGPLTRAAISRLSCVGGNPPPTSTLYINSISPNMTTVGSTVTLYGSGFMQDNTVTMGSGAIMHVQSYDGTSLSFTVPSTLTPACYYSQPQCLIASEQTTPGIYSVSVTNARGTTNPVSLTVTGEQASSVRIYSITPTLGAVGTTITINGFGFSTNNTVHFGSGAFGNVPISSSRAIACTTDPSCHGGINQTLVITVPSSIGPYCPPGSMCAQYMQLITPGTYTIYVTSDNGTSNAVTFTVTGANPIPTPASPSISGLDAPSTLALGSIGIWTVHTAAPYNSTTNLHYSVSWGDQQSAATNALVAPSQSTSAQSSATFTHTYSQAGTYTATFTVSNDSNQSATVSSTVTVTPLY